jgi:hypothetical protein
MSIHISRDVSDPFNPEKITFGGSGQYYLNKTIFTVPGVEENFNKILFPELDFEKAVSAVKFTEQSEETLQEDWVSKFYYTNIRYYDSKGISLNELLDEFSLFRKKIERVRELAKKLGTKNGKILNGFGNFSLQDDWNIENCAEIWAYRNALLLGIKGKNIAMRCVFYQDLRYAKPCLNCSETFAVEINEGRDLLGK